MTEIKPPPPLFAAQAASDDDAKRDLDAEFAKFHKDNPHVYDLFKRFCAEVRTRGFSTYSAEAIMQRIRWHCTIETHSDDGFKINDHHRARYARLLVEECPEYRGFFEFRKQIDVSEAKEAKP